MTYKKCLTPLITKFTRKNETSRFFKTCNRFKFNLSERKSKININNSYFNPFNLLCASLIYILEPILFLLYMNDLPQAVASDLLLYPDDTCIVFQHNVTENEEQLLRK